MEKQTEKCQDRSNTLGEIKEALDAIHFDGPLVMEPFLMQGGQVGRDIGIWRDVVEHPDLDMLARDAALFVKNNLV